MNQPLLFIDAQKSHTILADVISIFTYTSKKDMNSKVLPFAMRKYRNDSVLVSCFGNWSWRIIKIQNSDQKFSA